MYKMANKLPMKATIVMGGYTKDNQKIWDKLEEVYQNRLIKYHAAEAWAYGDIYKHAKVAIAPLKDTEFNSYRSTLKALEASAYGLPIVCSDVEAYKDVPKLKADFYKSCQRLLQNEDLRNEMANKLQTWANKEHNINKINQIRWETITI
jgi:glycosyltransferase involved in cell wall biosynthesis